jgi:hypothetical protein
MRGIRIEKLAIVIVILAGIIFFALAISSRGGNKPTPLKAKPSVLPAKPTDMDKSKQADGLTVGEQEAVNMIDELPPEQSRQLRPEESVFDLVIDYPKNGTKIAGNRCGVRGRVKGINDGEKVRLFVIDDYGHTWPQGDAMVINGEFQTAIHIGEPNQVVDNVVFMIFAKYKDQRTSQTVKLVRMR